MRAINFGESQKRCVVLSTSHSIAPSSARPCIFMRLARWWPSSHRMMLPPYSVRVPSHPLVYPQVAFHLRDRFPPAARVATGPRSGCVRVCSGSGPIHPHLLLHRSCGCAHTPTIPCRVSLRKRRDTASTNEHHINTRHGQDDTRRRTATRHRRMRVYAPYACCHRAFRTLALSSSFVTDICPCVI
jgi:hypothetical protein